MAFQYRAVVEQVDLRQADNLPDRRSSHIAEVRLLGWPILVREDQLMGRRKPSGGVAVVADAGDAETSCGGILRIAEIDRIAGAVAHLVERPGPRRPQLPGPVDPGIRRRAVLEQQAVSRLDQEILRTGTRHSVGTDSGKRVDLRPVLGAGAAISQAIDDDQPMTVETEPVGSGLRHRSGNAVQSDRSPAARYRGQPPDRPARAKHAAGNRMPVFQGQLRSEPVGSGRQVERNRIPGLTGRRDLCMARAAPHRGAGGRRWRRLLRRRAHRFCRFVDVARNRRRDREPRRSHQPDQEYPGHPGQQCPQTVHARPPCRAPPPLAALSHPEPATVHVPEASAPPKRAWR